MIEGVREGMKHVFVINPASGRKNCCPELCGQLEALFAAGKIPPYEVYVTKGRLDAMRFVQSYCATCSTPVRFYSCGGDGTLNEVAWGIMGQEHASFSCYPCGSGNDFVKYFGGAERFQDVAALMAGQEMQIDMMRVNERYCVNVCNFGLDTVAAQTISRVKRKPFLGGKTAYLIGALKAFCTAMTTECTLQVDGEDILSGKILLCTIANGSYVGSMFQCAPYAQVNDGLLEFCVVLPISRWRFVRMIQDYIHGRHLEKPSFQPYVIYRRCRNIILQHPQGISITVDGEILHATRFTIEVLPAALRFAVPE